MVTIADRRKTDRERIKRWRKNQIAKGNKPVQLMLTPEAQKVLNTEKERTGESLVRIINRAIMNLNKGRATLPKGKLHERHIENVGLKSLITKLDKEGMNHTEIAAYLNKKAYPTMTGRGKWHPATVRNMLIKGKYLE